ncbi:hypothetical protein HMPREF1869_00299 [Bacteroidales bacterium KA00251]|nr:hypothetical protein HMPREF1869_00299 [Bacteroidales bacterium KA00251]
MQRLVLLKNCVISIFCFSPLQSKKELHKPHTTCESSYFYLSSPRKSSPFSIACNLR